MENRARHVMGAIPELNQVSELQSGDRPVYDFDNLRVNQASPNPPLGYMS